jgi:hypothetical protein
MSHGSFRAVEGDVVRAEDFWFLPAGAPGLNAQLENARWSPATTLILMGDFPLDVNRELLRHVIITSRDVCVHGNDDTVRKALWDALVHEHCAVETLRIFANCRNWPAGVFAANTSLRLVELRDTSDCSDVFHDVAKSKVIRHLKIDSYMWILEEIRLPIFAMESLCSVTASRHHVYDFESIQKTWPAVTDAPVREHRHARRTLLRHPDVMPFERRQKLRALYECAGRALPGHVIRDIADAMCVVEIEWWPDFN